MAVGDDVIVRHTPGTTTYHFGRIEAICGEVPDDEATTMTLDAAGQTGMENPVAKRVALRILDNGDPKTPGQSVTRPRQDSNLRSRFRRPVLGITLLNMQKARSEACAPSLRQSRSGCVSGPTENLQYSRSLIPGSVDWRWAASPFI